MRLNFAIKMAKIPNFSRLHLIQILAIFDKKSTKMFIL